MIQLAISLDALVPWFNSGFCRRMASASLNNKFDQCCALSVMQALLTRKDVMSRCSLSYSSVLSCKRFVRYLNCSQELMCL